MRRTETGRHLQIRRHTQKIYENEFFMNDEYTIIRDFPNGLRAGVERMTFGNHRIVIGYVFNWEAGYERAF